MAASGALEVVAVAKSGVHIYNYPLDGNALGEPVQSFPAVPTAEGCVWSSDGGLLGLADPGSGGVTVFDAASGYEKICPVAPLIGGPVRNFYFSPLGTHLVTHERWAKDAGANVGVWDVKTGECKLSFILKKMTEMTWPPLKWTNNESHCCRMVQDGVQILPGSLSKEERDRESKVVAPGIMAFELAPRGAGSGAPHVAICIAESKGAPARCQLFRLDDVGKATATKNFFKAQTVSMSWNNLGSAVLVRASQEVDDTGKSYYGGSHLYFMRADGEEICTVATPDGGAIHDVQWNPMQDEFFLLHGELPCVMALHSGKKGQKLMEFGSGHRNTVRWNNFGRFLVCGGYGQLLGDTDFWDKSGKRLLGTRRLECCVTSSFAPDGRHYMAATTSPRMRVDNQIVIYDYCGNRLAGLEFDELLLACWRPRSRGQFQDRPPSPEREKKQKEEAKVGASGGYPQAKKQQAYRPPGARGGGGLASLLRKELGSTQADSSSTATKVFGAGAYSLPPGAAPPGAAPGAGGAAAGGGAGGGASRNARKKKAKEAAQGVQEDAPEKDEPPAPAKEAAAPAAASGGGAEVPTGEEAEKKIRALRKKLIQIAKLKETEPAKLDPLQREKIAGEGELIRQLAELGAEP